MYRLDIYILWRQNIFETFQYLRDEKLEYPLKCAVLCENQAD